VAEKILQAQKILRDFAHAVRTIGAQRRLFGNRQVLGFDATVFVHRADDEDERGCLCVRGGLQHVHFRADVDLQSRPGVLPRDRRKRLTGEMINALGLGLRQQGRGEARVGQVTGDESDARRQMREVRRLADACAENFHVWLSQQKISQVTAGKAIHSGDQRAHSAPCVQEFGAHYNRSWRVCQSAVLELQCDNLAKADFNLRKVGKRRVIVEPKFCERCGHALVPRAVEDNRLRPVCPACGFIVYRNPPIAAGVIAERADGKIALVLRGENPGKGLWGLPAGFMEIDETVEQAARRECLEETGLTIEMGDLFGVWSFHHEQKRTAGVLVVYAARVIGGEPRAGSDSVDVKFFALDEIEDERLAFSTHRDALKKWRERDRVTG